MEIFLGLFLLWLVAALIKGVVIWLDCLFIEIKKDFKERKIKWKQ